MNIALNFDIVWEPFYANTSLSYKAIEHFTVNTTLSYFVMQSYRGIQHIRNVFFIIRYWGVGGGNDCRVDLGLILGLDVSLLIAFCTNSLQGLIVAVLLPVNYLPGHNFPWRQNPAVWMAWKILSTVFQWQTSPIVLMGKAAVLHILACTHIVKLHL